MTTATTTQYVFVYDVFLRDAVKHVKIAPYINTWARAELAGKLYQLPTGLPILVEEESPVKVFGEVMTFKELDTVLDIIDTQEGYQADNLEHSRLLREVREVTISETGEKVQAYVYIFPKEKFNAKEMYAVHAHGGDWRKFVMMPRYDGFDH
jgi:gamma-glutamylcyclotransferase (GGCT)/AIG2-like uncharacterized protein YtfP